MHLVVREARDIDEAAAARDLALAPADVLFLSFSDSDLATAAGAHEGMLAETRPSLRLVNLAALKHPMSVDLFLETTVRKSKAVLVRLLGGLDYWRYGLEQLGVLCRDFGVTLAVVPGDGRPDPRLSALSTLDGDTLAGIEALLDESGTVNTARALVALFERAAGKSTAVPTPQSIPACGVHRRSEAGRDGTAAVVFYRSHLIAGDTAPVEALIGALGDRGLAATALYVPSLKSPEAADWLQAQLEALRPDVIVNATAFAARDGGVCSPLDVADCPVLQVAMANCSQEQWNASARGLSASDLAMHVVLPELDGRLFAGVVSFKEETSDAAAHGAPLMRHVPYASGIEGVADLAARWARLRNKPNAERRIAIVLSTYPGRSDQIAHAVGLDALASASEIAARLASENYATGDGAMSDAREIGAALSQGGSVSVWGRDDYSRAFAELPEAFRAAVAAAWGSPEDDASCREARFAFSLIRRGNLIIALQPERGDALDRKAQYHDPNTPPRHSYIAFYLWLRRVAGIDALVHLGAHGTLEWLPGKAIAASQACAPRTLLGSLPLVYPFIVNDPGEAAQAKRRLGAVTIGHKPPPFAGNALDERLSELERLVDEFASAEGLDAGRRATLSSQIVDAAVGAGIAETCGVERGMATNEALTRIDAFLCDIKEMSIRDGLHVLDATELSSIVRALDGRFIEPGPAGAPSRGRADVLPTGRNMFSVDPRAVPTQTAWANGRRAAEAILARYLSDHGDWPRAIVMDLWGSATLRTGGEELATALALMGARPVWDSRSYRVTGIESEPLAVLGRPRVDVTLRISGLFRDIFGAQLTLFDSAVQFIAGLAEAAGDNPLAGRAPEARIDRIFGPAPGGFGAGVMGLIDRGSWQTRAELGRAYLAHSGQAYGAENHSREGVAGFEERVRDADAFVHVQDHREIDLMTGGDFAAHEGGFAAAAAATGNSGVSLYHGDTGDPGAPRIRTLEEECARVVHGRAASPSWIGGQMRHGFRGAAEMAQSLDAAFAFGATAQAVDSGAFERLYEAYLGDPTVAAFLARENPAAMEAMRKRFGEAIARGLWHPRRNDVSLRGSSEAAE